MASNTVIVFGPTGGIASAAAKTAQELEAKVILAMRDPEKLIPGLSAEQEKAGGFERVQADLAQPDTVSAAIRKSGAKRAFFYLAPGGSDHMKSTIEALKSSGIELAVFLSSSIVVEDRMRDVDPSDLIPYSHSQVELNLQDVFGKENYVGVRPGAFATNTLRWKRGVQSGDLELPYPEIEFDFISSFDIGRVCGTILAKGKQREEHYVYLFGPGMTTQREAVEIIGKALNKNIDVKPLYGDDAVEHLKNFVSPPFAEHLVRQYKDMLQESGNPIRGPYYEEGKANVQKYSGKSPQTFKDWVKENMHLYTS